MLSEILLDVSVFVFNQSGGGTVSTIIGSGSESFDTILLGGGWFCFEFSLIIVVVLVVVVVYVRLFLINFYCILL
jgi:hypothetical protein